MSDRRKTLLIVDDDERCARRSPDSCAAISACCAPPPAKAALQMMEKEDVDLMLLDAHLPGISGFEVLKISKENYPYVEVIVISEVKELEVAIEAMRHGAYHYIAKDFDLGGAAHAASPTPASVRISAATSSALRAEVAETNEREFVVGPSRATRDIIEHGAEGGEARRRPC